MDTPPEVVEQLFNCLIVRQLSEMLFLSLSFCPLTEPVIRIFLYHCRIAHADRGFCCYVMFSWKSVYKNRKRMPIEPRMTT